MSTTKNNTTLLLLGGQGAADILTSGARPQALCSVMGGPALCSAQVSHVPIQHMCKNIGANHMGAVVLEHPLKMLSTLGGSRMKKGIGLHIKACTHQMLLLCIFTVNYPIKMVSALCMCTLPVKGLCHILS